MRPALNRSRMGEAPGRGILAGMEGLHRPYRLGAGGRLRKPASIMPACALISPARIRRGRVGGALKRPAQRPPMRLIKERACG